MDATQALAAVNFVRTPNAVSSGPSVPGGPKSVAIGDFDGDAKLDLAVAQQDSDSIAVLLGNGGGGFTAAPGSPFAVGDAPASVAVGDLNGDGRLDVAAADSGSDDVAVLLGNGTGRLFGQGTTPVGDEPRTVKIGDLNGDAKLDLATANRGSDNVTVLLGNGSGGFAAAPGSPIAAGDEASGLAVGDLNGDAKPDLATASGPAATVTVLLGNGSGGFAAAPGSPFATGFFPTTVVIGDFNGDSKPDLATIGSQIAVLLGNGSGGFTQAPGGPTSGGPGSTGTIGDLNADAKPDLISVTDNIGSDATLRLGNGTGGFTPGPSITTGDGVSSVAVGDLDGDGEPDFVTTNTSSNTLTVVLNRNTAVRALPAGPFAFSDQAASTVSPAQTIVVQSTADAALRVGRVRVTGTDDADFLIVSDGCTGEVIAVKSSCSVKVRFAPQNSGAKTATLTLTDNAQDGSGGVPLSGTGTTGPVGEVGPAGPVGPRGPAGPRSKVTCKVTKTKRAKRVKVTCRVRVARATTAQLRQGGQTVARRRVAAGTRRVTFRVRSRGARGFKLVLG